ncbi:DUF3768 domain-containing protein [Aureimonas jatrophae]|uniref:DUF3768 domain-containing protein n=1 Tax=Aureimonas jatrophae TaxID=1166073 RepID=A0A1H0NIB5_9HYPH|nr:DUF3768 domain-containing protein [Aureimonas jatrophae]MBB3953068.1 hypothetical protein [Aureimonas jatrophae]SDO92409.1 Protein of unknown function [Aureimonas jatrophae]
MIALSTAAGNGDHAASLARTARIASLNDALRQTFRGGHVVMTRGVSAFGEAVRGRVLAGVKRFDAFTTDNDPHGEHDFGSVTVEGTVFFWKIDPYDLDLRGGSPDPADPDVTCRVLTIMRADEY